MCSAPARERLGRGRTSGSSATPTMRGGSDYAPRGTQRHAVLHTLNACNSVKPSTPTREERRGEEGGGVQASGRDRPEQRQRSAKMIRQSDGAS